LTEIPCGMTRSEIQEQPALIPFRTEYVECLLDSR
jgi:hypothetical protein